MFPAGCAASVLLPLICAMLPSVLITHSCITTQFCDDICCLVLNCMSDTSDTPAKCMCSYSLNFWFTANHFGIRSQLLSALDCSDLEIVLALLGQLQASVMASGSIV